MLAHVGHKRKPGANHGAFGNICTCHRRAGSTRASTSCNAQGHTPFFRRRHRRALCNRSARRRLDADPAGLDRLAKLFNDAGKGLGSRHRFGESAPAGGQIPTAHRHSRNRRTNFAYDFTPAEHPVFYVFAGVQRGVDLFIRACRQTQHVGKIRAAARQQGGGISGGHTAGYTPRVATHILHEGWFRRRWRGFIATGQIGDNFAVAVARLPCVCSVKFSFFGQIVGNLRVRVPGFARCLNIKFGHII